LASEMMMTFIDELKRLDDPTKSQN